MAKRFFYVCAGLLCLAISYHLGAKSAGAQSGASRVVNRFAIVIGSADSPGGTFLLDTTTGESWRWQKITWKNTDGSPNALSFWDDNIKGSESAIRVAKGMGAKDQPEH